MSTNSISILGIRGIPANHGGFETFAEYLALYLVERDWEVVVYCQVAGTGDITVNQWNGVQLVNIPVGIEGALGTIVYDWKSIRHAARDSRLVLTLGYNTALFNIIFRLRGVKNIINMDGIEWKRRKWNLLERVFLYINERAGCYIGNHLVADHPQIGKHLATRVRKNKITMIPYGAADVEYGDPEVLESLKLKEKQYALVIARPEPENSILQIVCAFSAKPRNHKLVVLGDYDVEHNTYHREIVEAASESVIFPGAIYDKDIVSSLRYFARVYVHGHTVGGTNPSLVEALGAANPVLAHDNVFNRWVAGDGAHYFSSEIDCAAKFEQLLNDDAELTRMAMVSKNRFLSKFTQENILEQYEALLKNYV